jgi:hypothetical protein
MNLQKFITMLHNMVMKVQAMNAELHKLLAKALASAAGGPGCQHNVPFASLVTDQSMVASALEKQILLLEGRCDDLMKHIEMNTVVIGSFLVDSQLYLHGWIANKLPNFAFGDFWIPWWHIRWWWQRTAQQM